MKYTAGNLRTRDIDKEIRAYNRRLLQLQSKNEAFKILDTLTRTEVMRGRTDAEIARELNRLQELAKPEKQKMVKYTAGSSLEVPLFVREQVERAITKANKQTTKRFEILEAQRRGSFYTIEQESLRPITKGTGRTLMEVKKRLETAQNRGRSGYLTFLDEKYKRNYIKAIQNNFGAAGDKLVDRISKINGIDFYFASQDPFYGSYLEIEYSYGEEAINAMINKIENALVALNL